MVLLDCVFLHAPLAVIRNWKFEPRKRYPRNSAVFSEFELQFSNLEFRFSAPTRSGMFGVFPPGGIGLDPRAIPPPPFPSGIAEHGDWRCLERTARRDE